jgi:hypothetical protein
MLSYRTTRKVGTRFTISHLPNRSSFLFSEISLHSFLRDNPSKPVVMRSVIQKVKDDKTCGGYCERRCSPRCQAGGGDPGTRRVQGSLRSFRASPSSRPLPYPTQRGAGGRTSKVQARNASCGVLVVRNGGLAGDLQVAVLAYDVRTPHSMIKNKNSKTYTC